MSMSQTVLSKEDEITLMGLGSSRLSSELGRSLVPGHVDSKRVNTKTKSDLGKCSRAGDRFE